MRLLEAKIEKLFGVSHDFRLISGHKHDVLILDTFVHVRIQCGSQNVLECQQRADLRDVVLKTWTYARI